MVGGCHRYFFSSEMKPQKFCRIAGDDGVVGHVLGDHAARAHDGVISYRNFAQNRGARADRSAFAHHGIFHFPVRFGLQFAFRGSGPRVGIVDKGHAMADEDVVFNVYAFADERVAGNFAAPANARIFLNLDKRPDLGFVSDFASIHVDELGELDVFSELHVRGNAIRIRSQRYRLAAVSHRFIGGFQDANDAQSGHAVIKGSFIFVDAFQEIGRFGAQRFDLFHLRRPHVAGAVADQQLVQAARGFDMLTPLS